MKIVDGTPYIDQIKGLIGEYTKRLGRDLTFQNPVSYTHLTLPTIA